MWFWTFRNLKTETCYLGALSPKNAAFVAFQTFHHELVRKNNSAVLLRHSPHGEIVFERPSSNAVKICKLDK